MRYNNWYDFCYCINDVLLARNLPTLTKEDGKIANLCYERNYTEKDAADAIVKDRQAFAGD